MEDTFMYILGAIGMIAGVWSAVVLRRDYFKRDLQPRGEGRERKD